jgi:hypothetical protein
MNNVMQLVKHNLLKLVMAVLIALSLALSGVGHAQSGTIITKVKPSTYSTDGVKSGSGWGG